MRSFVPTLVTIALAALSSPELQKNGPAVLRSIDHVPVAVTDLHRAADQYRSLGFVLKEGRRHTNGIRNYHAKFPNATEIELITAPAAVDALTERYRRFLTNGDGPAFVVLFATPYGGLASVLEKAGFQARGAGGLLTLESDEVLSYLAFGTRQPSSTDRPEHFAHPNTAVSLSRVWLAADDFTRERRMLTALGARFRTAVVTVPGPVRATVAEFAEGSVILLPAAHQRMSGRRIVGLSVEVADLRKAVDVLGGRRWPPEASAPVSHTSLFVAPEHAAGTWLEFHGSDAGHR